MQHSSLLWYCGRLFPTLQICVNQKPQLKSAAGIEARDLSGGFESAFVQVAELPNGTKSLNDVKPAFLSQVIFDSTGKFGMLYVSMNE